MHVVAVVTILATFGIHWPSMTDEEALAVYLHGVGTHYSFEDFRDNPLYCDRFAQNPLYYDYHTMRRWDWVAVDVALYQSGEISCYDILLVEFEDGRSTVVRALDAIPEGYYIEDYPDKRIILDFPDHVWHGQPKEAKIVNVVNYSRMHRLGQVWMEEHCPKDAIQTNQCRMYDVMWQLFWKEHDKGQVDYIYPRLTKLSPCRTHLYTGKSWATGSIRD